MGINFKDSMSQELVRKNPSVEILHFCDSNILCTKCKATRKWCCLSWHFKHGVCSTDRRIEETKYYKLCTDYKIF